MGLFAGMSFVSSEMPEERQTRDKYLLREGIGERLRWTQVYTPVPLQSFLNKLWGEDDLFLPCLWEPGEGSRDE